LIVYVIDVNQNQIEYLIVEKDLNVKLVILAFTMNSLCIVITVVEKFQNKNTKIFYLNLQKFENLNGTNFISQAKKNHSMPINKHMRN